ncbi:MAG: hypothetical protein HRT87_06340 [Legionellales bacterium]|nr:hypothetical protein [Legionellales bacterium]
MINDSKPINKIASSIWLTYFYNIFAKYKQFYWILSRSVMKIVAIILVVFNIKYVFASPPMNQAKFDEIIKNRMSVFHFDSCILRSREPDLGGFYLVSLHSFKFDFRDTKWDLYSASLQTHFSSNAYCDKEQHWKLMYTNTLKIIIQNLMYAQNKSYFEMTYSIYLEETVEMDDKFIYRIVIDEMNIPDSKRVPKIGKSIGKIVVDKQSKNSLECVIL